MNIEAKINDLLFNFPSLEEYRRPLGEAKTLTEFKRIYEHAYYREDKELNAFYRAHKRDEEHTVPRTKDKVYFDNKSNQLVTFSVALALFIEEFFQQDGLARELEDEMIMRGTEGREAWRNHIKSDEVRTNAD